MRVNKAIFLDRDGTINVEKHYLYKAADFEFIPDAVASLKALQDAGYLLLIITNQSGIARGYYTEDEFERLNAWMLSELEKSDVHIEKVYYCPHHPDARIERYKKICNCRKPALGLYVRAIREFDIDLLHSWAIGDRMRDCAICERTDCRGMLVGNSESADIIEAVKAGRFHNVGYAKDLRTCAGKILAEEFAKESTIK